MFPSLWLLTLPQLGNTPQMGSPPPFVNEQGVSWHPPAPQAIVGLCLLTHRERGQREWQDHRAQNNGKKRGQAVLHLPLKWTLPAKRVGR